jgi:hypothetical protein
MTNEELNKWLAEKVMGWHVVNLRSEPQHSKSAKLWYFDKNDTPVMRVISWNPTKDRNQMAMCEERIPDGKRELYIWKLSQAYDYSIYYIIFKIVTASPRQRAEALYKTMEK